MTIMNTIRLLPSALMLLSGLCMADVASHRLQVERLFQLTDMEQKINESVISVADLQIQQAPGMAGKRDLLVNFLDQQIGWQALREDLIRMYMQAFTEQELEAMNAFYITPTGQKVITVLPHLVQQRNQLAMQRLQEHITELQGIMSAAPAPH